MTLDDLKTALMGKHKPSKWKKYFRHVMLVNDDHNTSKSMINWLNKNMPTDYDIKRIHITEPDSDDVEYIDDYPYYEIKFTKKKFMLYFKMVWNGRYVGALETLQENDEWRIYASNEYSETFVEITRKIIQRVDTKEGTYILFSLSKRECGGHIRRLSTHMVKEKSFKSWIKRNYARKVN